MDSVWRFKTDSTEALTFDTYYNLLWDAAHQYDLHQTKKGPQRKAFSSQQEEINDDAEYANAEEQFSTDPEPVEHSPYSVYQSSFHPKMPQKSFLPRHIWETLSESTKKLIIEHNKKVKLNNSTPYPSGSKTKPNPTLGKSTPAPKQVHQHSQDETTEESPPDTTAQTLVNKCLADSDIDPTDIQNVLSVSQAKQNMSSHENSRQIQSHRRYVFAEVHQTNHQLIDRGANGGLAGADMRVIHTTPRKINIVGIGDHELTGLNVVTAATLLDTQKGPIIGVFHEYAHHGKGKSIHAAGQMEWFNCKVDDRSQHVGGTQSIQTSEGYVIPLFIEYGLVYMQSMRIPTDHDLQHYPHVLFTSPGIWDTSALDHGIPPSLPKTPTSPTLRLVPPQGEDQPYDLTSDVFVYGRPNPDGSDNTPPMSIINFDDLLGRTFLLPMDENGERKRATISEHVKDLYHQQVSREDQLRFKLKIDGDQLDDLISYNQLMEYLEDKTDTGPLEDGLYRFECIKDHKGPYTSSDPEYNGSSYNLLIEWETGEQTWEPLSNIIASDPYTCAVYAKEHDLLNTPDWKLLKRHARTARRLIRTLKKSKYRQGRASRKYKHGWEVPRDYAHALQLDIHNGNNKWKEAIDLEIEQIKEYQVFKDFGKAAYEKNKITNAPEGHQKIRVHFVFDVKHCGKFKARLVADGHLTKEPMETVYSGVVSIRNLRLAMFLAELNKLELWGVDVGNTYLQALTREKLYIVGGPEFEELQGHVLVMYKALYGTRSGGACWHYKFFDILHDMGFKPSKADPDIWMKSSKDGSHYEYIAVYVDDLVICMKDPKSFCDTLKEKYKLKLKGVGPINYHLGCGYTRDEDGTLVADPRKYVEKILESYEKTFGEKPKKTKAPLVGGDHPESDTSDFCDQDQTKQYQTIVGQLIWLAGLGRFDIAVHVMTMSRVRQQPRIGHLERLKKIVGYLANFPHGALRFRLHEPDYSNLPHKEYGWQRTVYEGAKEEIPHDIPEPKGKYVTTTTYVDANLHHDQVTGKDVTACLHIVNATSSHWYTKRQATVETATYGSEFVAARIATDQIIDLRYTLTYLGVPVRSKSYMFGDNKSVVDSASIPTSTLSKKSTLASYHRVREAIAAGYHQFNWKDGKSNPAEILSKHWEFANIWPLLKPLLFWKGDTDDLNAKTKGSDRIPTTKSLV